MSLEPSIIQRFKGIDPCGKKTAGVKNKLTTFERTASNCKRTPYMRGSPKKEVLLVVKTEQVS